MIGRVHSMESMGLVDGPGCAAVVFPAGLSPAVPLLPQPGHPGSGRDGNGLGPAGGPAPAVRSYFDRSGGGVTFSGGEPLAQPDFLLDCLRALKAAGVHTFWTPPGWDGGDYSQILAHTDLVLYDVKHPCPEGVPRHHRRTMDATLDFVEAVRRSGVPMWVRHVVVPGLTDGPDHMARLRDYVATLPGWSGWSCCPSTSWGPTSTKSWAAPTPWRTPAPWRRPCATNFNRRGFPSGTPGSTPRKEMPYDHAGTGLGGIPGRPVAPRHRRAGLYPDQLHPLPGGTTAFWPAPPSGPGPSGPGARSCCSRS